MNIIEYIARFSLLFPVILFFLKKIKSKELRVLFYFNFFFFFHDLLYAILRIFSHDLSLFFNLLYIPLEFIFIFYFFKTVYTSTYLKNILNYILPIFLFLWGLTSFLVPLNTFNSILNGTESIVVIILCLLYFYEQIKNPQTLFIYSQPSFWGVIGFFLFFSGSFFVFLYKQGYKEVETFMIQYRYIHSIFFMVRNILFAVAMIIKPEKTPLSDHQPSLT